LDIIGGWKGVFVYSKGDLAQDRWRLVEILQCFLQSCRCEDPAAHCFTMIDDPRFVPIKSFSIKVSIEFVETTRNIEVDRYVFPCRLLKHDMRFEHDHPSSPRNQIQASAVEHGCWICPRFDPDNFRKTGVATYEIDV